MESMSAKQKAVIGGGIAGAGGLGIFGILATFKEILQIWAGS